MTTYNEILNAERHLWTPNTLRGMRLFFVDSDHKPETAIVESVEQLAKLAADAQADPAVHMVTSSVNTIAPTSKLAARRCGIWSSGKAFGAADIDRIRSLFVDVDGGQGALELGSQFIELLGKEYNLPMPFTADSGRGFHARWLLDAEATKENAGALKATLDAFGALFSLNFPTPNNTIHVDTKTYDLPRPCKVYGTSKKENGVCLPTSHMLTSGDGIMLTLEMLTDITRRISSNLPTEHRKTTRLYTGKMARVETITLADVESRLKSVAGISITRSMPDGGGVTKHELSGCLYGEHKTNSAVIFEFPDGGFTYKCFDAECAQHDGAQFLRDIGLKASPTRKLTPEQIAERREEQIKELEAAHGLPSVQTTDRQAREIVDDVYRAIATANGKAENPVFYSHNKRLSRLCRDDDDGRLYAEALTEKSGGGALSRIADFYRLGKNGDVSECIVSKDIINAVLTHHSTAESGSGLPVLRGITNIPILRPDGTLKTSAGYDDKTGLYYDEVDRVSVADRPSKEDAQNAARCIAGKNCYGLLSDFPFLEAADKVNTIGLLLTAVLKQSLGLAQMAVINAPAAGTGKTLLAQTVGVIMTGRDNVATCAAVDTSEEWRKQITARLIGNEPIVILDNVSKGKPLSDDMLAKLATDATWSDRELGTSNDLKLENRTLWIVTGNNVRIGGDLPRRVYEIRLDAKTENPQDRIFKQPDFLAWVKEHRAEILSHLFTMIRAWHADGGEVWRENPVLSYVKWSQTVGGILDYCGMVDDEGRSLFLANRARARVNMTDGEREQLAAFYAATFARFNGEPFPLKALADACKETGSELADVLPEKLGDVSDKFFSKRLGNLFKNERDMPAGAFRPRASERKTSNGATLWTLERMTS